VNAIGVFEQERTRLFGLAYRMTGSVAEAEDIVQDAWLRLARSTEHGSDIDNDIAIDNPAAFLTTVTTRLALDRLKSAKHRRETYVGPWLPEPILTDRDPAHILELDETVTIGFLHVLERLGPVDRAVFLLRDVFEVPYAEIAATIGRSEGACRQVAHRARERVRAERPRVTVSEAHQQELLDAFMVAAASGDMVALEHILADDVVLTSDGGAEHHAARRPVVGSSRVARFVVNLMGRADGDVQIVRTQANGEPALYLAAGPDRAVLVVFSLDAERVLGINLVVNPEKLIAARAVLPSG
jgi:RNA polymerase sigma-70 factor, ECF subfamily